MLANHAHAMAIVLLVLLVLLPLVVGAEQKPDAPAGAAMDDIGQALEAALRAPQTSLGSGRDERPFKTALKTCYNTRSFEPFWLDRSGRPQRSLDELIEILEGADAHGLRPEDYRVEDLRRWRDEARRLTPDQVDEHRQLLTDLELRASTAAVGYALDLSHGRYGPDQLGQHAAIVVDLDRPRTDPVEVLLRISRGDVGEVLGAMAPAHPQYAALKDLLRRLRAQPATAASGLQMDRLLQRGDTHPALPDVRRRINARCLDCSALEVSGSEGKRFDRELERALEEFQHQSGLATDGILGPETISLLNLSVADKIERVRLNLDRWRWYRGLDAPYAMVNVPEFRFRLHAAPAEPARSMEIVAGKVATPTPLFSDEMEYAVLRPYWNIPYSIATREILPEVKSDRTYLARDRIEVLRDGEVVDPASVDWQALDYGNFPYRLRQKPGSDNAMGLIKFMLPNRHAIYLHDTPAQALFERRKRAFSYGCIRLEAPFVLADQLLPADVAATAESLRAADHPPRRVDLPQTLPVHVSYFTVSFDEQGRTLFLHDIYGVDGAARDALAASGRTTRGRSPAADVPASVSTAGASR